MRLRASFFLLAVALQVLCPAAALARVAAVDALGREVILARPAQRIVALAPHLVENAWAAGAGPALVGVVSHSDYPPEAAALPVVGDFSRISLETLVALKPDLVLMWHSGNGPGILQRLEALGLPVWVDEPRRLEDLGISLRAIGRLAGTTTTANAVAERLEQRLETLRVDGVANRPRVFYQLWHQPMQTVGGQHLITEIIEHCGGRNVFGDVSSLAPQINAESVLAADPEIILASGIGSERPAWLDAWRDYPQLSAVKRGQLFSIDPDLLQRPTPRIVAGVEQVCGHIARQGNE